MDDVAFSRELLQAKLLVELMSQAVHEELVLKGGLAMRAVPGSTRYTTDIDLDASPWTPWLGFKASFGAPSNACSGGMAYWRTLG
jgi:hypothetical protein